MHSPHRTISCHVVLALLVACSEATPTEAASGAAGQASAGGEVSTSAGQPAVAGSSTGGGGASGAGGSASAGTPTIGGGENTTGSGVAGSGGVAQAGTAGAAGSGGSSPERLKRVLAFELVDVNPDTGALRGHNGGGADEALLKELATEHAFEVDVTNDGAPFTAANLARYDAIAFCSPHYLGQKLSEENRGAIEAFVRQGGGWLGWHYGLHIETGWPFLKTLGGGATALGHVGGEQKTSYGVVAPNHPVTQGLPKTFEVMDDFIRMSGDPSATNGVTVLATAALAAPPGGDGHPVIWVSTVGQGRAFYSMFGHNAADFNAAVTKTLMWNALRWTSRKE